MAERTSLRLDEIVERLGGRVEGDASIRVSQVAALASAQRGEIAFLANPKLKGELKTTAGERGDRLAAVCRRDGVAAHH